MSREVDERRRERLAKDVLQVLTMLRLHPAGEARDAGLHVEQVGEGTASAEGQNGREAKLSELAKGESQDKKSTITIIIISFVAHLPY